MSKFFKKIIIEPNQDFLIFSNLFGDFDFFSRTALELGKNNIIINNGNLIGAKQGSLPLSIAFMKIDYFFTTAGRNEQEIIKASQNEEEKKHWITSEHGKEFYNRLGSEGVNYLCNNLFSSSPLIIEINYGEYKIGITPFKISDFLEYKINSWDDFVDLIENNEEYRNRLIFQEEDSTPKEPTVVSIKTLLQDEKYKSKLNNIDYIYQF